jgi:hypothetical protein
MTTTGTWRKRFPGCDEPLGWGNFYEIIRGIASMEH